MAERQNEKRRVILEGAAEVFRMEGFDNASMDRIAEVAEVSKRTVYNHFGSKDALFAAVVHELLDELHALKAINWDPSRSVADQLRQMAMAKARLTEDENVRALVKVVLGVAIKRPNFAQAIALRAHEGDGHLTRWLEEATAAGALDIPDIAMAARLFWASIAGALFWPQLFEEPLPLAEQARILEEIIATFLARYARSS